MLTIEERYKINHSLLGISYWLQDIDGAMETIDKENQYPGITCFVKSKLEQAIKEIKDLQDFVKEINNGN